MLSSLTPFVVLLICFTISNAFFCNYLSSLKIPMRALRNSCDLEMNAASSTPIVADFAVSTVMKQLGGKIVVSGIGSREEDEFLLNLLNEQVIPFLFQFPKIIYLSS